MIRSALILAPRALLALVVLSGVACGPPDLGDVDPALIIEPEALDFGERPVLDELAKPLRIVNYGGAPMTFSAVRVEGDDASAFLVSDAPKELDRGAEREVTVTFTAREKRDYAATLVFLSPELTPERVEVPLTGKGSTAASATIEPRALDFGRVGENRSAVRRVKVTSTGSAPLKIRTLAFKGGSSAAYGFVGSTRTPMELEKHVEGTEDSFVEITVKFAPTSAVLDTDGVLVVETTDPDNATVEIPLTATINRQPVAVPGREKFVAPGVVVELDGSESNDPDGDDPITFRWTLAQRPQGSATALTGADTAKPSLTPDQPGLYAVDLVVTDAAALTSKTERVVVHAVSAEKLVVELVWDHPVADLDLHFLAEGESLDGAKDCTGYNPHPDFGVADNPNDDPVHSGDRLSGFGPEVVTYEEPYDGRFNLAVKYQSAQGSAQTQLRATVRVYLYGVVQRELQRVLATPGEVWNVGVVEWPNGRVTTPFEATP